MKVAPTREELREVRLNRYRKRASSQRAAAKKRAPVKRQIAGGRTQPPNIRAQGLTETNAHFDERKRLARKSKAHAKRRNQIARASRRRNRR